RESVSRSSRPDERCRGSCVHGSGHDGLSGVVWAGASVIGPGDIWYGLCTYWTDDLTKLSRTPGGIPCCPNGHVGFEAHAPIWWEDAQAFETKGNPGYIAYLEAIKETCGAPKWDRATGKP